MDINRKRITVKLNKLLEQKLSHKIYAKEVTFDYGTKNIVRVDYMTFEPENQMSVAGIERGVFTCYEVKSCKEDFKSGYGLNFIGDRNYLVMTMQTYKSIIKEIPWNVGVYVAIPDLGSDREVLMRQFENPSDFANDDFKWKLACMKHSHPCSREKSMIEVLFCMLRAAQRI